MSNSKIHVFAVFCCFILRFRTERALHSSSGSNGLRDVRAETKAWMGLGLHRVSGLTTPGSLSAVDVNAKPCLRKASRDRSGSSVIVAC